MKIFDTINEKNSVSSAVTDFLDSLDTDMNSTISEETIQNEELDNTSQESIEENIEDDKQEVTALVVTKPNSLFVASTVFKKSIKISIKSFLISLSLGFLNLFF